MKFFKALMKVLIKSALLSIAPYQFWKARGFFAHGKMEIPSYVMLTIEKLNLYPEINSKKKCFVELGPGDSAAISKILIEHKHDSIMIEDGIFIQKDLVPSQAKYLTHGVESFKEIANESVDVIFSHAVLEHVSPEEVKKYYSEWSRTLKPGGRSVHLIDMRDHMTGGLQNRVFKKIFGNMLYTKIMRMAYLYTNGLPGTHYLKLAEEFNFSHEVLKTTFFKNLNAVEKLVNEDNIAEITLVFVKQN
jgi:SAM-dependent methyltransferase